jgi:hypothetical protein
MRHTLLRASADLVRAELTACSGIFELSLTNTPAIEADRGRANVETNQQRRITPPPR